MMVTKIERQGITIERALLRGHIFLGLGWTVLFTVAAISVAVATPGNWEWWRVALAAWPAAAGSYAFVWGISKLP